MLRPRHRARRRSAAARRRAARRQRVQLARGAVAAYRADARAEDGVEVLPSPQRIANRVHSKHASTRAKLLTRRRSRRAVNAMERTRVWSLQVAAFAVIAALLAWFARPAPPSVPFADAEALFAAAPPLEESAPLRSRCVPAARSLTAVAARRPALWRNSAVRGWAALGNWSAASLADRIPRRSRWALCSGWARSQPRREFVLSTPRRGSAPLLRTVPAWEALSAEPATNLTLAQLLGAAPAGGGAHYGSGTLSEADHATGVFESAAGSAHWRSEELMRDLQPLAPLLLADVPAATPAERAAAAAAGSAPPRNRTTLRLWLGGGGVLARTHYDKGHNLFVQLVGRKRVLLWPPSELPALHLYPANHEAFRQSQVPLVREAAAAGGDAAAAPPAAAALAARFPLWERRARGDGAAGGAGTGRSAVHPAVLGARRPLGRRLRLARRLLRLVGAGAVGALRLGRRAVWRAPGRRVRPRPRRRRAHPRLRRRVRPAAAAAAARLRRRAARLAIRAARRRRRRGRGRGGGAGRDACSAGRFERQAAPQGGGGAQERGALDGVGGGGSAARARRGGGRPHALAPPSRASWRATTPRSSRGGRAARRAPRRCSASSPATARPSSREGELERYSTPYGARGSD